MQPFHFPPMPPRFMPHPPPPFPPANPFPTLDTEPTAKRSELDAEIERAMAAESGIVESAVTAATESVTAAVSGIADTSASAIEEMRASVTAAVSGANAAAARAERVVQDATLRDRVSGIASAAAATAVGNLFSSGGLADQVASRAVSGVVDSAVEALQSTYATKGEIRAKANKSYVDACLKQAVLMTQSPDGLSQIQVTNSGVPTLKVKTITATHENQATYSYLGGWKHYVFGWNKVADPSSISAPIDAEYQHGSSPFWQDGDEVFLGSSDDPYDALEAVVLIKRKSGSGTTYILSYFNSGGYTGGPHGSWVSELSITVSPGFGQATENGGGNPYSTLTVYENKQDSTTSTRYLVTEASVGDLKSQLSRVWHPDGSLTSGQLTSSLLVSGNEGKVYNLSEAFTTTADFKEGAGKEYAAGSNVAVVPAEAGQTGYRFDVLGGSTIDLSAYALKSEVPAASSATPKMDGAGAALQSTYATKGEIRAKANKSYVDACLKQAVLMTQSPDGLSQIQIGNDGVPKVVVAKPFKAIWTDSNSGEHKFSWDSTDGTDTLGTPEHHYPEDESTATSGREIILREAKNGAYLSITDAGVTRGVWANYPVYSGGVFSGANIVAYNPRVSVRNIALEAAQ